MNDYGKMDPTAKARWVEALRSGNFRQGKYALRDGHGCNCCLGVLAEINGVKYTHSQYGSAAQFDFDGEVHSGELPAGYCGLDWKATNDLVAMNDGHMENDDGVFGPQKTFLEIANFIEENL